ncbi:MAG: DUF1634 domain-containing protein [Gammaproteobacteria bacterium]|nr:MAG: DUF1634 domain-containing protein [Gammaproteobacteria bacterium]
MYSVKKMEEVLSITLLIGILIAMALVVLGSILYLLQYGSDPLQVELLQTDATQTNIKKIGQAALTFSPAGIIELGLLVLVVTQFLRVAILTWFYAVTRDIWFTIFSGFILLVLIGSLIWRN